MATRKYRRNKRRNKKQSRRKNSYRKIRGGVELAADTESRSRYLNFIEGKEYIIDNKVYVFLSKKRSQYSYDTLRPRESSSWRYTFKKVIDGNDSGDLFLYEYSDENKLKKITENPQLII